MNGFFIHAAAAYSFFYSGLISVVLFIVVIALDKDHKANKWLPVPGMACAASFGILSLVPYFTQSLDVTDFRRCRSPSPHLADRSPRMVGLSFRYHLDSRCLCLSNDSKAPS